jgi:hypothetical protein
MTNSNLPRLLYIGDIPIEDSVASSTLLFRLFQDYPANSLCIVQTNLITKASGSKLAGVAEKILSISSNRFSRTRLHRWALGWEWIGARYYAARVRWLASDFSAEAVVTTVPFSAWAIANEYAKFFSLPLHILLWDDILVAPIVPRLLQARYDRAFLSAYCNAASRLCISPQIEQFYRNLSGAIGEVVYPFGGRDTIRYYEPPTSVRDRPFTFAFAGSLFLGGYRKTLMQFADACEAAGCDLIIIGQPDGISVSGNHVQTEPYMPTSNSLIDFIRKHADALVLLGSFEPSEKRYCSHLFPSRLVAYSATALPCFGYGLSTFTGVDWLVRNIGTEVVCQVESKEELVKRLKRFVAAGAAHASWGRRISEAGSRDFDYRRARDRYFAAFAKSLD